MSDRSRDVSNALTEMRTVRSRAESAIARINTTLYDGKIESRRHPPRMDEDGYVEGWVERFRDQDADEMVALMQDFIAKTEKFAKKGRP